MLNKSLWRTATFRLTVLFGAVFATGIALLLSLVYIQTAGYLTRRVDRALIAGPDGRGGRRISAERYSNALVDRAADQRRRRFRNCRSDAGEEQKSQKHE